MKKTLIALAAVAVAGAASAQAVVTGEFAVSYQKDLTATGTTDGKGLALTDAYITVGASEDLGGGLKATGSMKWETGAARAGNVTRADASLGVSGAFGSVTYLNTRTSDLLAGIASPAVSLPDGLYDSGHIVSRSAVDAVAYTLPKMVDGLTLTAAYVEGNDGAVALNATNKSVIQLTANYAAGPLTMTLQNKSYNKATVEKSQFEASASYDFGVAKIAVAFDGAQTVGGEDATGFSITAPLGAFTVGANYFERDAAKTKEVGAAYALSKRTTLSVASGKVEGADAGKNGSQFRVRLGHKF